MFQRLGREACPDIRNTHREFPQKTRAKDAARLHLESSQLTRERIEPKVSCCGVSLHYDVSFYFVVLRYRPHCKRIIGFAKEQNHSQNYSRPISVRMHVMDSRLAMIGPAAWSKSQPRSASRLSSPPRDAEFYLAVPAPSNLTNPFLHFRFISVLVY